MSQFPVSSVLSFCPLDNIRVMVIIWRLRGNIIRTAVCWIVWHNVHSQQYTYMSSSYRSNRLGLSHWDPYTVCRGGCLELYYCNMESGSGGIQAWSWRPTGFLQCFDTVGLVIWPVKIIPEMTYNVSSGTLSLYSTNALFWIFVTSWLELGHSGKTRSTALKESLSSGSNYQSYDNKLRRFS